DFRGERFAEHSTAMKGNTVILCLTHPELVAELLDGEVVVEQLRDELGVRETEDVGVALHRRRVLGEALATEVLLRELVGLDQRSPRAVEDEDPLAGGVVQGGDALVAGHAACASRGAPRPSRRQTATATSP